jgi:dGTP triphosphohydrolase
MLEKGIKRKGEAGWIAEEIFEDTTLNLRSRCLAIDDQIARGVLDLEDALEVYEVSLDDYVKFFFNEQNAQAEARFHGKSSKFQMLAKIKYVHTYFNHSTRALDSSLIIWIGDNMNKLENDFEHGRVKVLNE